MIPTVIYDANCCLCERAKQWFCRRDRRGRARFLHFENTESVYLQPDLAGLDHLETIRFIDATGRVWKGPDGVVRLLALLPLGRPAAWFLSLPGAYALAERAYNWLARNRYGLFGSVGG